MKKIISLFLFLSLQLPCYSAALDRRISDNDGDVLDITSTGGIVQGTNTTLAGGIKNVGTAGVGEVLASSTPCKRVLIKASLDNNGNVFVGGSDVDKTSENGFPLDAGEVWIGTVDNLADIWIDVTVSGEGVSFSYEN